MQPSTAVFVRNRGHDEAIQVVEIAKESEGGNPSSMAPVDLSNQNSQEQPRQVRFQQEDGETSVDVIGEVPSLHDLDQETKLALWWQPDDFQIMKKTAKSIACSIRESHQFSSRLFYTKVLKIVYRTYAAGQQPTPMIFDSFMLWVATGHSRRGLEHWSVPGLSKHRQQQKVRTTKEVVKRFHELSTMHSDVTCDDESYLRKTDEEIREFYQQLSATSRRFALALGKADEFAARREHGDSVSVHLPDPPTQIR